MPDYALTKEFNKVTGQLPDRVTVDLSARDAWLIVKQMLIQLEQGNSRVRVDVYGKVERIDRS